LISEDSTPNRKDLSNVIEKDGSPLSFHKFTPVDQLLSNEGNSTSYGHPLLSRARTLEVIIGFDNLGDLFDKNFL